MLRLLNNGIIHKNTPKGGIVHAEIFTNNKHPAYTYYYYGRFIGAGITGTI